jgi:large subunit ribosomal protein L24
MKLLRKNDPVIVISGKHKGKVSTIERFVDNDHVIVAGINEVQKAKKGEGYETKLLPMHISTVQYYFVDQKAPTRLSVTLDSNGRKNRKSNKFNTDVA